MAKQRLYSLDVLRGLTVAAMIVVNNAGGDQSYYFLQHSQWNGLTLCDMVFPTFLFIMGISTYISLSRHNTRLTRATLLKVLRRTLVILLIGWGIHWLEHICKAEYLPFANLRLTGVLPRIALCYCATAIIACVARRRAVVVIITLLLAVYAWILLAGNGLVNDTGNILARVDRSILGEAHLYTKRPIDPEGLLSTISALAHTLIGYCFGAILMDKAGGLEQRVLRVMTGGYAILLAGLALAVLIPLNKRIWSPSYVLVSCGLAALALGLICYMTDIRGHRRMWRPFDVFGVNPLFLYVLSEVVAILMSQWDTKDAVYAWIHSMVPDPYVASAVYSLAFVAVMWAVGYVLWRRKIYIKI